jgi:hypothetical protein
MMKPIRYESIQEPLDDEERELMNPDEWDWDNPIAGVTVHEPTVTLRFSRYECIAFWQLADAQGVTTEEAIKQAALAQLVQDSPR